MNDFKKRPSKTMHPSAASPIFAPRPARVILAACLLGAALASGCARRFPDEQVPRMKLLVMDFEMSPGLRENPREIRGWWFGARTLYQNPRAGAMFAERVDSGLAKFSFVNLFSRVDVKYYLARKRQNLKESYDYLEDAEVEELMRQVPPLDFARELGADKLLTGRIIKSQLSENRTFHWWSSSAHVQCQMIDVLSGRVEWEKEYKLKGRFDSQFTVQDEISKKLVEDLRWQYFAKLATADSQVAATAAN